MIERIYQTRELADLFRVKPSTVRKWVRSGWISPISGTRPYLFPESEIARRQAQKQTVNVFA